MAESLTEDRLLPDATHNDMANAIRALAMDAVQKAESGHPGMPMGMADVATVLFTRFLKFDASRSQLARPRPLRALRRPRLDAALFAALSHRLSGDGRRAAEALPPARLEDPRTPGIWPCARHRDHDRAARGRGSAMPSAWRSPSGCSMPATATASSAITPIVWLATAA